MPFRLAALIVNDVGRYPDTGIREIHQRVGLEIARSLVRCAVEQLAIPGGNVKDPKVVVDSDILTALPEGVARKT